MANSVVTTSEVRAALGKITKRFDAGDTEPVFFGSHRRAQAVLVPIATECASPMLLIRETLGGTWFAFGIPQLSK